jgi:hypothetical protein
MTSRQRDHFDRWGYPYVMDDFQFHMTLTGSLLPEDRDLVATRLQQDFSALEFTTLSIDRIALFEQESAQSRFEVKAIFDLTTCG